MAKRVKADPWRRIGIDEIKAADIESRYPPGVRTTIARASQVADRAKAEELATRAVNVATLLWADFHYQSRPRVPQRRAALDRIQKRTRALLEALGGLDDDMLRDLANAANADKDDPSREPPRDNFEVECGGRVYGGLGNIRLNGAIKTVRRLRLWAWRAKKNLKQATRGRPREEALLWAAQQLGDAWLEVTGSRPTLRVSTATGKAYGPFLDYLTAALSPVLPPRLRGKSLEASARAALYGEKSDINGAI